MPALVAVLAGLALVAIGELVRWGLARAFRLPTRRFGKLFVVPHGGPRPLRALAILSGTVVTYLGVVALAAAMYTCSGMPSKRLECIVTSVEPGYPAAGKLERGDRIIAIDGKPFDVSPSLVIDRLNGAPVKFTVVRHGETRDVTVQPFGHDGHWVTGFRPKLEHAREMDAGRAVGAAFRYPFVQVAHMFPAPAEHADPGGPKRIIDEYPVDRSAGETALGFAMLLAAYLLVIGFVVDLVRAAIAITRRDTRV